MKLEGHFVEQLYLFDMTDQCCFIFGKSDQMNIPTPVDQVVDGHVIQTLAKTGTL